MGINRAVLQPQKSVGNEIDFSKSLFLCNFVTRVSTAKHQNNMRTLNISISELEFNAFGLTSSSLSFSEFLEIINKELLKQNLRKSVQFAEKYKLSKMTMEEITDEVKAARRDAKGNS